MVLEECECGHREHGVVMKTMPRASLEMVEPEFLLHLLVRLLTRPSRFDRRRESFESRFGGMTCQIVCDLTTSTPFRNEPRRFAW